MKEIILLGSTGSIGTQTLEIVRNNRDRFAVNSLTCNTNIDLLAQQIEEFKPKSVCVGYEKGAMAIKKKYPHLDVCCGEKGILEIAGSECDLVVNAMVGISGLSPTYEAINAGRDVALANKETLVTGGKLIMNAVRKNGVNLIPVDSEHSAIFQSLASRMGSNIRRIILTASGGPFRGYSEEELESVTVADALNHPRWDMGSKISIDSATMMNKGLEVIEARWLFDVPPEMIDVHVHKESIVHSAVEFEDGAIIAQMGLPDMRMPISLALNYPDRLPCEERSLDLFDVGSLHFEKPDMEVFQCLNMAYEVLQEGEGAAVALNGANEQLVAMFLAGEIGFLDIQRTLRKVINRNAKTEIKSISDILNIDMESRAYARELMRRC